MASSRLFRVFSVLTRPVTISVNCARKLEYCTSSSCRDRKYGSGRGEARDGIAYGPLTDLPDWSYADGSPAPETRKRRVRRYKKMDVAHRIYTYLNEVDRAALAKDEEGNVLDPTMLPTNQVQRKRRFMMLT
ncbi:mitochondrial translation [Desmophyllum pertusum]|uniref:Large ribosomal subunit protein mL52 n=1 Tax=Desmophyllum pertusum TaxID=174260 RepID=A0A9W9YP45_9CNID|nr:mitochondrial translation [Desmophyllum pertusum]